MPSELPALSADAMYQDWREVERTFKVIDPDGSGVVVRQENDGGNVRITVETVEPAVVAP